MSAFFQSVAVIPQAGCVEKGPDQDNVFVAVVIDIIFIVDSPSGGGSSVAGHLFPRISQECITIVSSLLKEGWAGTGIGLTPHISLPIVTFFEHGKELKLAVIVRKLDFLLLKRLTLSDSYGNAD